MVEKARKARTCPAKSAPAASERTLRRPSRRAQRWPRSRLRRVPAQSAGSHPGPPTASGRCSRMQSRPPPAAHDIYLYWWRWCRVLKGKLKPHPGVFPWQHVDMWYQLTQCSELHSEMKVGLGITLAGEQDPVQVDSEYVTSAGPAWSGLIILTSLMRRMVSF